MYSNAYSKPPLCTYIKEKVRYIKEEYKTVTLAPYYYILNRLTSLFFLDLHRLAPLPPTLYVTLSLHCILYDNLTLFYMTFCHDIVSYSV